MTQGVANQELCGSCSAMTEALHRLARALADVQEVLSNNSNAIRTPSPTRWTMPINPSFVSVRRNAQPAGRAETGRGRIGGRALRIASVSTDSGCSTDWEVQYGVHVTPPPSPGASEQAREIQHEIGTSLSPTQIDPVNAPSDTPDATVPISGMTDAQGLSAAVTASITAPLGTIPAFIIGTEAGDAVSADPAIASADIADGSAAMPSNILVENLPAVYIPPELLWYAVIVGRNPGVYQGSHLIMPNTIGIPSALVDGKCSPS